MIEKHNLNAIAIGNGTGKETEAFIAEILEANDLNLAYTIVNEAGASVYSAAKLGQAEFPHSTLPKEAHLHRPPAAGLHGRAGKDRPPSVGVGQYQHDVNQKQLASTLTVLWNPVNQVGVDLNTASPALLAYVAESINRGRQHGSLSRRKRLL